jgi:hypothetical protein
MAQVFTARLLGRHDVRFYACPACQHLRSEAPYWLAEAYAEAITRADTGLVMRNLQIARLLGGVLFELFDRQGRFLDTAGGTGLLTRLLRDIGFDAWWADPYCRNVMAAGFEAPSGADGFEAVTAFEALEHMADPLAFIGESVQRSRTRTLIFTTELYEHTPPPPDWWYYAFPAGQHISFFTRQTLHEVARRLGLNFVTAGGLHMLTGLPLSQRRYAWIVRKAKWGWLQRRIRHQMQSRTQRDHDDMMRMLASTDALRR